MNFSRSLLFEMNPSSPITESEESVKARDDNEAKVRTFQKISVELKLKIGEIACC